MRSVRAAEWETSKSLMTKRHTVCANICIARDFLLPSITNPRANSHHRPTPRSNLAGKSLLTHRCLLLPHCRRRCLLESQFHKMSATIITFRSASPTLCGAQHQRDRQDHLPPHHEADLRIFRGEGNAAVCDHHFWSLLPISTFFGSRSRCACPTILLAFMAVSWKI